MDMKRILLISALIFGTLNFQAQCYPDRHNGNWFDGWISCETSENPNPTRGQSHWIMYDFNQVYELGASRIWNVNDPSFTNRGLNEVAIDYSIDGITWTELGIYNWPQANGESTYEGFEGPNFENAEVRYVIITALSNWGAGCYGFSEIRIDVEEVIISGIEDLEENTCLSVEVYPNPHVNEFKAIINSTCTERISYILYDPLGRVVLDGGINEIQQESVIDFSSNDLPSGLYHLTITQGDVRVRKPIVKLNRD